VSLCSRSAHTPEDLVVWFPQHKLLFSGDLLFRGRIPFVGQANSSQWIEALDLMARLPARWVVPGHGPLTETPVEDVALLRKYLRYLRAAMGLAVTDLTPLDQAYAQTDWSDFDQVPMFSFANRMNAYNTYLLMEAEAIRAIQANRQSASPSR
jgi:glyoxylase-like metal-dependent hydrolase (beta-lactamase superfamily II)